MQAADFRILAINPGSTSTKFGLFSNERALLVTTLRHSDDEMAPFRGRPILEQQNFRSSLIERDLTDRGFDLKPLAGVVGRGGLLRPLSGGTYRVNEAMLEELRRAERGEHAANLGAFLAQNIARRAGTQAYIVDPVSVDEWPERARYSGTSLFERQCLSHALNTKAVAKRYAKKVERPYSSLRLIVAHLGSGVSVSAHEGGRMIEVTNSREEGAFSPERAGGVPAMQLVSLCFSGHYTAREIENRLFREGGLFSYLRTKDLREVERRIASDDAKAAAVFDAMVYQIAKEIGAAAAVLCGRVDALLITGGMAYSERLIGELRQFVGWIAPLALFPGEDELEAMTEGVLRALRGEEAVYELSKTSTARRPDQTPQEYENAGNAPAGER
ncbi:MAG: butyrate kinase [Alphaproteobacteria bacterium]|nr:butyrate kinase [Alphaproteobacteria bacterium]MDE2111860.1 butyrate kinase [Alphaproteobacteria bacterium]MDE2493600.1 butyrate kinase [Alphaproteobacteria bacterium]